MNSSKAGRREAAGAGTRPRHPVFKSLAAGTSRGPRGRHQRPALRHRSRIAPLRRRNAVPATHGRPENLAAALELPPAVNNIPASTRNAHGVVLSKSDLFDWPGPGPRRVGDRDNSFGRLWVPAAKAVRRCAGAPLRWCRYRCEARGAVLSEELSGRFFARGCPRSGQNAKSPGTGWSSFMQRSKNGDYSLSSSQEELPSRFNS
jgi:hypothetical protein